MSVVLSAAGLGSKAIRIAEEFERLLRMTAWLRECLETEMAANVDTKGKPAVIGERVVDKWGQLVRSFDSLVSAKVRFDKNVKSLVDSMTPEEELEEVRKYIRSLPPTKRRNFLEKEVEFDALQRTPVE